VHPVFRSPFCFISSLFIAMLAPPMILSNQLIYSINTPLSIYLICSLWVPSLWTIYLVRHSSAVRRLSLFLIEPWDVRGLYIWKTADLTLQLLVGTFPCFLAIGFYFQVSDRATTFWQAATPAFTLIAFCPF
jgi:hypothetical protein